ncbi:XRE family transcriptional regulator [Clostridiaceae bacterium]|nr:helix-turn-helix transcriptional regulator [Clostridium sp.]NBI71855.1 XRE family transcriptional regulator [Clostridiaceae bacterium]
MIHEDLCTERNWSYYQLSKASGIAYSTLNTMINRKNMPNLMTLEKLC